MAKKRPFYKKFRRTLYETVSDSGESILRYRGHDDKEHYVASSEEPGGGMTEVTWQELKDKRDNGQLIAGSLYRITDYQCTTTQENTQSAGHQFDIVLLALSENKLAEEGWAMQHANDTYFANSNLSAWKVWYCLDNDKSRFAWADDNVDGDSPATMVIAGGKGEILTRRNPTDDMVVNNIQHYAWNKDGDTYNFYTLSQAPETGDNTFEYNLQTSKMVEYFPVKSYTPAHEGTGLPNGHGVIYRLIDEWNIDYPCDFKNMQMLIPMDSNDDIDRQNPVRYKYCYAFTDNTNGDPEDLSIKGHAINIKVKPWLTRNVNSVIYFGPGTLFYTNHNEEHICKFSNVTVGIAGITIFINSGYNINIFDGDGNIILKDCGAICIGYNSSNIMLDTVVNSTFGSNCQNIQLANKQNLNYGNNGIELATKS